MKKRILAMLLAGTMVFGLAACGGGDDKKPEASNPPAAAGVAKEDLKVGFVHIGDEGDMGYTYNMVLGVKEMQKNLGLSDDQIITKYNVTEDEKCADALNELVDAGCQIVFATSFGFGDYVTAAARENPEVQFCHATGFQAHEAGLDNLHNCFASIYEGRYLAGIAAGMKAKEMGNPKLGYVGAYPFAEVVSGFTAFYLGAKSVYPEVTMEVMYTNSWSSPTLEAQVAQALIDDGCGVISQHSDTTAPATTAEANGAFQVGYNADMISAAPKASLVSARVDWGVYYTFALNAVINGETIPDDWCQGYADGAVYLSPLNEDIVAEGTAEAIEAAEKKFVEEDFHVFSGPLSGYAFDANTGEKTEDWSLPEGEFYDESGTASAPSFCYIIDGITSIIK